MLLYINADLDDQLHNRNSENILSGRYEAKNALTNDQ